MPGDDRLLALAGTAAGVLLALVLTLVQPSTYRADASIALARQGQPPGSDPQLAEAAAAASELFHTRAVAESAIANLRLDESPDDGVPFTIFKFRTMRQDAEAAGAVWASESDPRITRSGKLMRKTRLDELPQLWNVLRGEMSIVGPRPERPEFMAELQEAVPFWSRRHLVKPGITGWAQVCRGYTADADGTAEKLAYDLWYLRHRSLVLDLAICVKTFTTLVTGSGAR